MTVLQNTPEDFELDTVPRRSGGHRSVLGRAAVVIDAFDDGRALSLDDLTARTGLPRSTVYRLAEQLRDVGWIERVAAGYRIGLRLFEVGGLAADAARLRTQACTWLFQAQQQCGQIVHLGILDGDEVVYIDKVGPARSDVPTRVGGRLPAHHTAIGRALLSAQPEKTWKRIVAQAASMYTRPGAHSLKSILETARRTGIASDFGDTVRGLACVAAPIISSSGVVGAVSITGSISTNRATLQTHARVVKQTAESIASCLIPAVPASRGGGVRGVGELAEPLRTDLAG
ncbi:MULTISPECIES: IclR family transcriptional regulator domain-containing protein [unclassified Rhodococcus (in: high G+C Gram-positive bacteria)]|uniref:IclR family transcriptional regulator n=1 Tax=Rhodococcus sp. SJ-3 TaxID=3454628 RepID=UPI003F7AE38D